MVAAVGIRTSQGRILAAAKAGVAVNVSQAFVLTAINFPSPFVKLTQARILGVVKSGPLLRTTQARILAAVKGRVANPRLRVWTFTLDGHDFYVLRLGDSETLVYDMATEQWVNWDSLGQSFWRPNTGTTWIGAQALAHQYGSSVVAGDDTWGLLWFLDPEQPYDEHPDHSNPTQEIEFNRVVMGQVPARGRGVTPCYAIFLAGDNYGITATDFVPGVTLEYSDDGGISYEGAGTIGVNQSYEWLSLGQIDNPGRLFKITDNGVFTRIDDMKMNDD